MRDDLRDDGSIITSGRTLDHAAKVYDLLSPLFTFGQERHFSRIAMELLRLNGTEKVLDVGCGTGTLTIDIAGKLSGTDGPSVIGIDAAPKMIEVARQKSRLLNNIRFDAGIAEDLPYESGSFDCAVSTFFFHHIDLKLKARSLTELRRVLKKGGRLVIVDVDIPTNWFGSICAYSGYMIFRQNEIKENIDGKLRECIEKSGFEAWRSVSHHLGYISIFELLK